MVCYCRWPAAAIWRVCTADSGQQHTFFVLVRCRPLPVTKGYLWTSGGQAVVLYPFWGAHFLSDICASGRPILATRTQANHPYMQKRLRHEYVKIDIGLFYVKQQWQAQSDYKALFVQSDFRSRVWLQCYPGASSARHCIAAWGFFQRWRLRRIRMLRQKAKGSGKK